MNAPTKHYLILAFSVILSISAGVFAGIKSERSKWERYKLESIEGVYIGMLAQSSLDVTRWVGYLNALRQNKIDEVVERMEVNLDFALINLADTYSLGRDYSKLSAKSLRKAAEYRTSHPHRSSLEDVAMQVDRALALAAKIPKDP